MHHNPGRVRAGLVLREVFFDAGGTILNVRGSVGEVYAAAAARRGIRADAAAVERAFRSAWSRSLLRRRDAQYLSTDHVLREEWRRIVEDSFDGLVPREVARDAFEELYDHFSGPDPWVVADGAAETFAALRSDGMRLGILSNWDSRLPAVLEKLGLSGFFDHLVISYRVGVEKPHPRIFEEAARAAGAPPSELLLVGDSWEQDIVPARRLGWRTLWISRQPGGSDPDRVESFREILDSVRNINAGSPPGPEVCR